MTTKTLKQIVDLAREGWCDAEIARRTGVPRTTVHYHRVNAGIPVGKKGIRGEPPKRYTVYDKKTSAYICEGTPREIAAVLGHSFSGIRSTICRSLKGKLNKYEFYEVTDDECY